MALFIPNSIENDTPADAAELQENYATIQTYTNSSLIHRDGSVAMTQPLTLVGDPTQNNHAANKQYVDAVEAHADLLDTTKVAKAGDTMTGALIAGQAKMFTRAGLTEALFSNKDAAEGSIGFIAHPNGTNGVVQDAGMYFHVWNKKASVAGHDLRASFGPTGTSFYQTVEIDAPGGGVLALHSAATGSPFIAFFHAGSRYGYIQQTSLQMQIAQDANRPIDFYIGGGHRFRVMGGYSESYQRFVVVAGVGAGAWDTAHMEIRSSGGTYPRLAFHHPGVAAPQLRAGGIGGYLEVVNGSSSAHEGIAAQTFYTVSAAATKKGVRPLRDRKIEVRKRNVKADTVEQPDIMALRPVVYRLAVDPERPKVKKDDDDKSPSMEPEPASTVPGREGRRERLGLVADDVQHIIPSAVVHNHDNKPMGIDYAQITVALLDHVQQLTDKVAELEAKLS